ncbi:ABC transporter substrate-binding protein [Dietzia sp. NPDC055343]
MALPSKFATNVGMVISPAAIESGADIQNGPGLAGSGAYLVDKFIPQESLELVRADDDYWDENGGRLAGMTITSISDAATRINGIRTGVTDLTWVSSANEVVAAAADAPERGGGSARRDCRPRWRK